MSKYLLIFLFLMCVSLASATYINWVVGGAGTGADKASTNAGFYDADTIDWDEMQGTNGASMGSDVDAASTDNGGGNVRLTADGDQFDFALVGMGVKCDFAQDESADGYHLITAFDAGNNTIDLDTAFGGDGEECNVVIGGALANPGDVPDTDDFAVGYHLGSGDTYKIWIRALADYTTVDESDSILYVNTAGTDASPIIWEAHYAEVANEKGDFGIVTFDANGKTNAIETAVGGAVYHVFIGISCERATDDGANLNTDTDDYVTFIRCQFINNGAYGVQGDEFVWLMFCDFDTNGSGGADFDYYATVIACVFRNNTGDGIYVFRGHIIDSLFYNNSDSAIAFLVGWALVYGCTIDGNNGAGTEGVLQDSATSFPWAAVNNIFTDCVTAVHDDTALRQGFVSYNNLYNSNTTDAHANITPQPVDGDNWGNLVKNVAENVLWTADDNTYILAAAYKQAGVDAFYTKAYWDDFNGGAGDNPPSPLSGLSFMDMGGLQREEAGSGGGQPILGGSVVR